MKEEQTTNITKKKNRKILIIGLIAIVVVAVLATVFIYASGSKDRKLKDTLQLAENYLNELDYEKAIATYEEAIKIDPKSADAYCGLADTYVAMGDKALEEGNRDKANEYYDKAIQVLENGANKVSDSDKENLISLKSIIENKKNKSIDGSGILTDSNETNQNEFSEGINSDSDLSKAEIGDVVCFGTYDYRFSKGEVPFEWDVLDKDDDRILLISHYIVTDRKFNDSKISSWEESEIRYWLNNDFYNEVFNKQEQKMIQNTKLSNPSAEKFDKEYRPKFYFEEDDKLYSDTCDKVFLLSWEEVILYYGPVQMIERECTYVDTNEKCYELEPGVEIKKDFYGYSTDDDINCSFWLRSVNGYQAMTVGFNYFGNCSPNADNGICPAVWVEY